MEATITGSVPSNLIIHQLMQVKLGVLVQSYDKKESFHFSLLQNACAFSQNYAKHAHDN